MNLNKKLPVWLMVVLDLALVAAIILPFAYVHHVRDMWGIAADEESQKNYGLGINTAALNADGSGGGDIWFIDDPTAGTPTDTAAPSAETPDTTLPASPTDVGETTETPTVPTETETPTPTETEKPTPTEPTVDPLEKYGYPVVLNDDASIREYVALAGLPLLCDGNAKLISLYRSNNIFTTLFSVTEPTGKNSAHKYYVYDIRVRSVNNLFTVAGTQKNIHELIADGEAYSGGTVVAAVNGDYSSNKNHCRVVVRNGELYRNSGYYDSDLCVMYYDGTVETYTPEEFDFNAIEAKNPYQIWDFGPELLDDNGKAKTTFDSRAYDRNILTSEHPRTALGYFSPGHYCFVVVDGRQKDDDEKTDLHGLTIKDLAKYMEALGCVRAYNMDGGDSSQAYMNGTDVRIDKERGSKQRVLSDIICVGEFVEKKKEDE